jgi:hypothetical protein
MDELQTLRKKQQEVFDKHIHHMELAAKHEKMARKYRYEELDIKGAIRAAERELSAPIKVVYGQQNV